MGQRLLLGVCARPHRSELMHAEAATAEAGAILREEHGAGRVQLHRHRDDQEQRREHDRDAEADDDIECALHDQLLSLERWRTELEEWLVADPEETRPKIRDLQRTRRVEKLAAGRQAHVDQRLQLDLVEMSRRDHSLYFVLVDESA